MRDLIGHVKLSLDKNVIVNTANNDGIGVGGLSGDGGDANFNRKISLRMYFFGKKNIFAR